MATAVQVIGVAACAGVTGLAAAWTGRAAIVSRLAQAATGVDVSVASLDVEWGGRQVIGVVMRAVEMRDTGGRRVLLLPHVRVSLAETRVGSSTGAGEYAETWTDVNIDVVAPPQLEVVFDNLTLTQNNLSRLVTPNRSGNAPWWTRLWLDGAESGRRRARQARFRLGESHVAAGGRVCVRSAPHGYARIIPDRVLGGLHLSPVDLTSAAWIDRWLEEIVARSIQAASRATRRRSMLSWVSFGVFGGRTGREVPAEAQEYARRVLRESWVWEATRDGLRGAQIVRQTLGDAVWRGSSFERAELVLEQVQAHLQSPGPRAAEPAGGGS